MKKIIIIKAGDTFPHMAEKFGRFDQWVFDGLNVDKNLIETINVENGEELPEPSEILGAVMTGSHSMVTERLDWSEKTAEWIKKAVETGLPFFGICYGHQLLAESLGGEAGYHPKGIEIGTVMVSLTGEALSDELFSSMPLEFPAHTVHSQTTISLPYGAVCLAKNAHESHHAFRYKNAWGVQFHPEFNAEIMKGYIREIEENLADSEVKMNSVTETEEASRLLNIFALYCLRH
ncbi:MAG: GMP synthase [Denitrovibrio sp.]|nr:MAG: GMP synthase [Denitrovibrio sp.]